MKPTIEFITNITKGAGEILRAGYGNTHKIDFKGPINLVTEVDREAEEYIISQIRKSFPTHSIVAEESGKTDGKKEKRWFIDPVDGTSNYARGMPLFATSIAYAEDGEMQLGCIYDPMRDECFYAEKGKGAWLNGRAIHVSTTDELINAMLVTGFPYDIEKKENNIDHFTDIIREVHTLRRLGSAALDLVYVASGRLDGYWEIDISPWDIAAGTLIIEEAGGLVTTTSGDSIYMRPPYDVIASNGILHEKLLSFFK
jgi:myo-inositol-1(or 4)-monophosphatase